MSGSQVLFLHFVSHPKVHSPVNSLMSASVPRTDPCFCIWLSLTAPILVLAHSFLFLDGGDLGVSPTFGEASNALKDMFYSKFSGFVEEGPSACLPPHCGKWTSFLLCALSTQHSSCSAVTAGEWLCPSALPQRESLA